MRMFAFILLLVSLSGFAQPHLDRHYVYKQYSTYDGLVQSQVNSIMQDSKGYLWVCTKGGLSRFDGKSFQNFVDTKDGERVNIKNIVETEIGFIACSQKKIFMFTYQEENPQNWKFEDIMGSSNNLFDFFNISYFFSVEDSSLYMFNIRHSGYLDKSFIHLKYNFAKKVVQPLPIGNRQIRLSYNDRSSVICLSRDSIFVLRNGSFGKKALPSQFDIFALNPIDSSLYAFQRSTKTIFRIERDFTDFKPVYRDISILLIDYSEPNVFIINKLGQVIFINEKRQICLITNSGTEIVANVNFARFLFTSREDNLWVCTEEGIFNFFKLDLERYVFSIAESMDNVWSIVCALDSTMWFGGYTTGLWTLSKKGQVKEYGSSDFKMPLIESPNFRYIYGRNKG